MPWPFCTILIRMRVMVIYIRCRGAASNFITHSLCQLNGALFRAQPPHPCPLGAAAHANGLLVLFRQLVSDKEMRPRSPRYQLDRRARRLAVYSPRGWALKPGAISRISWGSATSVKLFYTLSLRQLVTYQPFSRHHWLVTGPPLWSRRRVIVSRDCSE